MYIPKHFLVEDEAEKIAFIRSNSFGILISNHENEVVGSHIPMHIETENNQIRILGHVSASNLQWKSFEENESSLAIFQGSHAYISPSLYEEKQSVPTWNYSAVHAYGKIIIITGSEAKTQILEKMIRDYEPDYLEHWQNFPNEFKEKMLKGIVAFEMVVTKLEGKFKLSQNKTMEDQKNVADHLLNAQSEVISDVGKAMKDRLKIVSDRQ